MLAILCSFALLALCAGAAPSLYGLDMTDDGLRRFDVRSGKNESLGPSPFHGFNPVATDMTAVDSASGIVYALALRNSTAMSTELVGVDVRKNKKVCSVALPMLVQQGGTVGICETIAFDSNTQSLRITGVGTDGQRVALSVQSGCKSPKIESKGFLPNATCMLDAATAYASDSDTAWFVGADAHFIPKIFGVDIKTGKTKTLDASGVKTFHAMHYVEGGNRLVGFGLLAGGLKPIAFSMDTRSGNRTGLESFPGYSFMNGVSAYDGASLFGMVMRGNQTAHTDFMHLIGFNVESGKSALSNSPPLCSPASPNKKNACPFNLFFV